jgi:two-component system, chemotaxis family, sensor histidine kinase and response regulator WspE
MIRVLLIDDDPLVLRAVERVLKRTYALTACDDPESGLRRARTGEFDVVVSDLSMPHLDGIELLSILARDRGSGASS